MASGELTQYGEDPATLSGATRIGTVWLMVPPINIHFNNVKMEDVMTTMRNQSANHIATGRGLYSFDMDIVFSGIAMINDKLAPLIAQIRRTPFTVIYNQTITNICSYSADPSTFIPNETPIAITGYTIHTEMDLPDTLVLRLSFMVFNYSPYLRSFQYLKQTLDNNNNPIFTTPAAGITDSNLFYQYYNSLLADSKSLPDFLFNGELETMGQVTAAQWQAIKDTQITAKNNTIGTDNGDYIDQFASRIDPQQYNIIKNGDKVVKLPLDYASTPETFTIGFHVYTVQEALDLSLGAYKSRRLKKWVYDRNTLRQDVIQTLTGIIPFNSSLSIEQLIIQYGQYLIDTPVSNVANKYIKQWTIASDNTKSIVGIACRRSIPITVLPIASSPIPTAQYVGGSDTTITLSIYTNDEDFVNILTSIDHVIQRSQRNIYRYAGSELNYIKNDITGLNGSFIVTVSTLDIQTLPDNPGSYVITWNFTEEGEVLRALTNLPTQIKQFKKDFVKAIASNSTYAAWQFGYVYGLNRIYFPDITSASYPPSDGIVSPSYIYSVVIPSLCRAIRNGFIRYLKTAPGLQSLVIDNPDALNIAFFSNSLVPTPPPALTAPITPSAQPKHQGNPPQSMGTPTPGSTTVTSNAVNSGNIYVTAAINTAESFFNEFEVDVDIREGELFPLGGPSSITQIWQLITTGDIPSGLGLAETALYNAMASWLASKAVTGAGNLTINSTSQAKIIDGFAECIINSVNDRLELVLNSPHLLEWEVGLLEKAPSSNSYINPNLASFQNAIGKMNCYPDLGLPFDYIIETNLSNPQNIPISGNPGYNVHTFYDPDFYMASGPALLQNQRNQFTQTIEQILNDMNISSTAPASNAINGPLGNVIAANHLTHTTSTNGIVPRASSTKLSMTDQTRATVAKIAKTNLQNTISDNQTNLQVTSLDTLRTYNRISEFNKDPSAIYANDHLLADMGNAGSQTKDGVIAESLLEHNIVKSTQTDFNPDIDQSMPYIINEGREQIMSDDKFYSMNRAYPTFRLYFRIEENPQWFLFDELFDYRAVESIRYYKDKVSPTCTLDLVLNNYGWILTDLKALMAKQNFKGKNANSTDQLINQYTNKPLKSLFVQAGTQIQLKLGYSGSDTGLTTVFNGFVSEVNAGDERMEILCQGYGIELLTDSGINSLIGLVLNYKQLMYWMMLGSDTKHLGGLWQPSLIPHGISDLLHGWLQKDNNIYLNEENEPGALGVTQSYNAANMTKWDVFQDIAAAHVGYIAQVFPFFNAEMIFFGLPEHLYQYTQDMGVTKKYPILGPNDIASIVLPNPNISELETAFEAGPNNNNLKSLNYLQWLSYSNHIKDSYNDYLSGTYATLINSDLGKDLLLYCKWVELLSEIAADPDSGNVQYNLFDVPVVTNQQNTLLTTTSATVAASTSTPTATSGISSQTQGPGTTTVSTSNSNAVNQDPNEAQLPVPLITKTSGNSNGLVWGTLPHDQQIKLASSLRGRFISLKEFIFGGDVYSQVLEMMVVAPGLASIFDDNNPSAETYSESLGNIIENYISTGDETQALYEIGALGNNQGFLVGGEGPVPDIALINAVSAVYEQYGIGSLMAIIAWSQIAKYLSRISSDIAQVFESYTGNGPYVDNPAQTAGSITNLNLYQYGVDININPDSNDSINVTSLKSHVALRNQILSKLININPLWQQLLNTVGVSPLKKRFRQYFIKSSHRDIVSNNICVSISNMWNRVKVKYKRMDLANIYVPLTNLITGDQMNNSFSLQAGFTLDEQIIREVVIPVENARTVWQARNYATSLLAEGIRHMYTGTLTILGDPEIHPYDIIFIQDDYTKMYGPIEVKSVTHTMSAESGFITIIEPNAVVTPLGTTLGWATVLLKIFDIGLMIAIAVPFVLAGGQMLAAGAIAGEAGEAVAGDATANFLTRSFSGFMKFSQGIASKISGMAQGVVTALKGVGTASQAAYDTAYATQLNEVATKELGEGVVKKILDNASQIGYKYYTTLGEIPIAELKTAMAASGLTNSEINGLLFSSNISGIMSSISAALIQIGLKGSAQATLAKSLGLTIPNLIKTLGILSVPIAYQMFAGMDDNNYACPLEVTCLRLNDEPYFAGIDGMTHESGIWNYTKDQWFKVIGSVRTIDDYISEKVQAFTDSFY